MTNQNNDGHDASNDRKGSEMPEQNVGRKRSKPGRKAVPLKKVVENHLNAGINNARDGATYKPGKLKKGYYNGDTMRIFKRRKDNAWRPVRRCYCRKQLCTCGDTTSRYKCTFDFKRGWYKKIYGVLCENDYLIGDGYEMWTFGTDMQLEEFSRKKVKKLFNDFYEQIIKKSKMKYIAVFEFGEERYLHIHMLFDKKIDRKKATSVWRALTKTNANVNSRMFYIRENENDIDKTRKMVAKYLTKFESLEYMKIVQEHVIGVPSRIQDSLKGFHFVKIGRKNIRKQYEKKLAKPEPEPGSDEELIYRDTQIEAFYVEQYDVYDDKIVIPIKKNKYGEMLSYYLLDAEEVERRIKKYPEGHEKRLFYESARQKIIRYQNSPTGL